jgi:Trp operon repressor
MTRVSKERLDRKTERQLFSQFVSIFISVQKGQCDELFSSLFTETERIMFVKRVGIVLLISEGYSTYAIAKALHVSDSTVRVVLKQCKAGKFDPFFSVLKKKTFDIEQFWKTLEVLLRCGLPPRGKGRWKWLYEMPDEPRIKKLLK